MKKLERSEMKNLKGGSIAECPVLNRYCILHDPGYADTQFQCTGGCEGVNTSSQCRDVCGAVASIPIS